jgi:hypothetical protein
MEPGWYAAYEVGGIVRETGKSARSLGLPRAGWYFWPWGTAGMAEEAKGPCGTFAEARALARRLRRRAA